MTRTAALSLAAAVGFAATLTAQSTTSTTTAQRDRMNDKNNEVTVTGCLSRGADGKYMLTDAHMEKSASTATTGTTGSETATTSTSEREHNMSWRLEGGSDLDRHVGHKIQVTGTSATGMTGTTSTATESQRDRRSTTTDANQPRLDVTSVKMLAPSCS
jgi:hypothetical protein